MSMGEDKLKAAVLVISDRSAEGLRPDLSGQSLSDRLGQLGFEVKSIKILPDDKEAIVKILRSWVSEEIRLIITTGGTGLGQRDLTPEATLEVIERRVPGMEEAMRHESMKITPHAMISRAVAGTVSRTLIVNLPGNPKGALENLRVIEPALEHSMLLLSGEKADP